ncbi:MAG TPA: LamG-like jellyroll fold domain-containing protein [Patescibacteria group bacterium]|nr:LamG-like jellyroll fold domain-containing protein [Patescibacteria group bacterium]
MLTKRFKNKITISLQLRLLTIFLTAFFLLISNFNKAYADFGSALKFNGTGTNQLDRIKIPINGQNSESTAADIGDTDFTLEFWMRAKSADNTSSSVACGTNDNWIFGNIVIDRDRFNQDRKFGLSIAGGKLVFGVSGNGTGNRTICGGNTVLDDIWHHVAIERRISDGYMWIFVDGIVRAEADGPDGVISYPDNAVPCSTCCTNLSTGPSCNESDPYLVIAAEKHDAGSQYPSYNGYFDELRISNNLRYQGSFTPPSNPYINDINTLLLYHLDEGNGTGYILNDASGNGITGDLRQGSVWIASSIPGASTPPTGGPSLTPTATPIIAVKPGDANGDGKVNGADYLVWFNNYKKSTSQGALAGDFNEDGFVNGGDYLVWFGNYGK